MLYYILVTADWQDRNIAITKILTLKFILIEQCNSVGSRTSFIITSVNDFY